MSIHEDRERVNLGAKLKEAREYLGFSQDDVASVLGVGRAAVSLIESGQRKVEVTEIKKLAQFLKRPISHFTGEKITAAPMNSSMQAFARKAEKLSDADWEELTRFADYLTSRSQQGRLAKS